MSLLLFASMAILFFNPSNIGPVMLFETWSSIMFATVSSSASVKRKGLTFGTIAPFPVVALTLRARERFLFSRCPFVAALFTL